MKSEAELAEESAARAAAADALNNPDNPADVDQEPMAEIDPAQMHALMVVVVKGVVLRVDQFLNWEQHPDDGWYDATTKVTEILLEKYMGKMATSPEAAMMFQVGMWVLPNLLASTKELAEPAKEEQQHSTLLPFHQPEIPTAWKCFQCRPTIAPSRWRNIVPRPAERFTCIGIAERMAPILTGT